MSLWCCCWSLAFFIVWEFRMCVRCIWSISSPPIPPLSLYHCSLPVSYISFLFSLSPLGSLNAFSAGAWDHLLEHGQSFGAHIPKENRISLSQWSSIANTLSVGDKTFGTPPHSMLGFFLSGLTLRRHCQCCHSCCVFMSAADILILEITVAVYHLLLLQPFCPLFSYDPWALGGKGMV